MADNILVESNCNVTSVVTSGTFNDCLVEGVKLLIQSLVPHEELTKFLEEGSYLPKDENYSLSILMI